MFKENGREMPANKTEVAGLKGKTMVCAKCGYTCKKTKVSFASAKCPECDTPFKDLIVGSIDKITG